MRLDHEFDIKEYVETLTEKKTVLHREANKDKMQSFLLLCDEITAELDKLDADEIKEEATLTRQKRALLGFQKEREYYKNKIGELINQKGYRKNWYPEWFASLSDAVYDEILGFAGISKWLTHPDLKTSISCKIIGDRIYFKVDGKLQLQPQRISRKRRDQLKRTLLLVDATKQASSPWHEIYTAADHQRVTIYNDNGLTKDNQDVIILRRYIVNVYTFEEQAKRNTIPFEAIPLLKSMVAIGYNVTFTGPPECAKTTFLTTYQSYENAELEGVSLETDPEIPHEIIMPTAPIIQFCPDNDNTDTVIERIKRSDAQYIEVCEARSGKFLNIAIEAANMGIRRCKTSFHNTETVDYTYDVAEKVSRECGGSLVAYMIKAAKSFNYVFNFYSLPDNPAQKRMKGLWEVRFNPEDLSITMHQICRYDRNNDNWVWSYDIGDDKKEIGYDQDPGAFRIFDSTLKQLSDKYPNTEKHVFKQPYMEILLKGGRL